jgi:hypothetical protein
MKITGAGVAGLGVGVPVAKAEAEDVRRLAV